MQLSSSRVLVTGGAGFVGSHLCERLLEDGATVSVVDRFSNSSSDWVPDGVALIEGDLSDLDVLTDAVTSDLDAVFHFAADKAVDADSPTSQFEANTEITTNVFQQAHQVGVEHVAFTSSSTVYGEAPRPTPEDYAPLEPISMYGASKLAGESLGSVYAHSHDMTVWNFRFANIVGPRLQLGAVIPDFIAKLSENSERLEILGDGRQEKSYMHVDDCIDAICHVVENTDQPVNTFNLGTRTSTSVTRIADIVADEMGLDPEYDFTGGSQGWTGDVPRMGLSIEKLSAVGWEPTRSSDEAVRQATRELL